MSLSNGKKTVFFFVIAISTLFVIYDGLSHAADDAEKERIQVKNKIFLIQNVESGLSLVPYRETVHKNFGELCIYKIGTNSVPDQRWYFVDTENEFLIKNVESGLSLVPYRETVHKNFGKLCLYKVVGQGVPDQRWHLVKTNNGILIQSVESGLSLVPYRETVHKNFGKLCLFKVKEKQSVPDQKWRFVEVK